MKLENPLDVSEELDNRITIQLLNSHTTYTSSLTFEDVNNFSLDTLQIKGGTSGIQVIDFNNNSIMDLDNTQISINKLMSDNRPLPLAILSNIISSHVVPSLQGVH